MDARPIGVRLKSGAEPGAVPDAEPDPESAAEPDEPLKYSLNIPLADRTGRADA